MSGGRSAEELFSDQRPRLMGLAYRMVGGVADAEDIVAEAWARWCAADHEALDSPEAWLTTVTTRLAIDWLRSARHQREGYLGPWLPEPVVSSAGPEESAELADSLTLGFLTMLDRLDPVERAVFLMADVFGVRYADIAATVDKSEAACRQIASRARRRLRHPNAKPRSGDRRLVDELLVALWMGDMEAILARLAPDVVCITDGGPLRRAARRPVVGAARVARFLANLTRRYGDRLEVEAVCVNGEPGVLARLDGEVDFVAAFEVDDHSVRSVRLVRNPDKLRLAAGGTGIV
ncbi:MAG TPA: RNA polymerase sigma factor SigJ [Acidimicrobiales bacterium]|nr:RNA polymerase sigma factor SigJ [Acidimicrobiales bacterium]